MINLEYLKSEKEKVEIERKRIEKEYKCRCSDTMSQICPRCNLIQKHDIKIEALNLGIQAVENTIKDEIEFLQSIMCFAMFRELTERLDKLRNQLQKQKEDTK